MPLQLTGFWKVYKLIFKAILKNKLFTEISHISDWREKVFINIILYATPLSLLALLPSLFVLLKNGYNLLSAFDAFVLISISSVVLINSIKLPYKKIYVVVMFYVLAIIKTLVLGSFEIGAMYLLAVSVFITLLFSPRVIIATVIANVLIYTALGVIIYHKLFQTPLINKYPLDFWIFYSCNFLFLNLAIVVVVHHIIIGLEKTISKQANLRLDLQHEIKDKSLLNAQLNESVSHYKSLFFSNPSPMWIFDPETLNFIQVNGATLRKYGYTRAEFKNMTIKDIRPVEDIEELLITLDNISTQNGATVSTVKHLSKKGEVFYVEVRCSDIIFQGKIQRLVISRDITEQIERTKAIEKQNEQLREIAYMQSHVVRAPLSRILGLVNMLNANQDSQAAAEILGYLDTSAKELDDVIRAIINKTEGVNDI